jgi:hypothetical protein
MLSPGMIDSTLMESQYKQAEGTGFLGKISRFLGGSNDGVQMLGGNNEEQVLRDAIYGEFKKIIVSLMHCWNDLPIFTTRDFNFTRSGIYPYSGEDDKAMNNTIERWAKAQQDSLNDSRGTISRDITTSTMASTGQQSAV